MFLYRKGGGLRAKTSSAMFSTGDSMQGKDKDKGNGRGKGKGKVFGKWRLENVKAKILLYFFCYCAYLIVACYHFFVIVHNFLL